MWVNNTKRLVVNLRNAKRHTEINDDVIVAYWRE